MTERFRARILLITRNLPPLLGGMERLNLHMIEELSKYADVQVIGPRGAASKLPASVKVFQLPLRPLPVFLVASFVVAVRIGRSWRPQVVLGGSGLVAPIVWFAAWFSGARAAIYLHGLDIAVPSRFYRMLWLPFIRRMHVAIANSHVTASTARVAGLQSSQLRVVHPGVELPLTNSSSIIVDFRERRECGKRPILLSVGRLTHRKGLLEFISNVLPDIVQVHQDVLLIVIGGAPSNALHSKALAPEKLVEAATLKGVERNVALLGVVDDDELAAAYRSADVHIFPVRSVIGDPEGFGMVAVEAAAYGVPTVAYATGGIGDAVKDGVSGVLVPDGDEIGLTRAVLRVLEHPMPKDPIVDFARTFEWSRFGERLWQILSSPGCGKG